MKKTLPTLAFPSALILTLLVLVAPAQAAPRQCDVVCTCESSCIISCSLGASIMNCGAFGICKSECFASPVGAMASDSLLAAIFRAPADGPETGAAPTGL